MDAKPIFSHDMRLNIMNIPDILLEEHIRTSGYVSSTSSRVQMLQELCELAYEEGFEPRINYWDSKRPGKTFDAAFQVIIPNELVQKILNG